MTGIKAGDRVRHKRTGLIRYVEMLLHPIPGAVILDHELDGYYHWHEREFTLLKPTRKGLRLVKKRARENVIEMERRCG